MRLVKKVEGFVNCVCLGGDFSSSCGLCTSTCDCNKSEWAMLCCIVSSCASLFGSVLLESVRLESSLRFALQFHGLSERRISKMMIDKVVFVL